MFNNMHYSLPPWSISILPDCKNVAFNTAKVCDLTSLLWRKSHPLENIIVYTLFEPGWSPNVADGDAVDKQQDIFMGNL